MTSDLILDKTLLNAKFEGYKLQIIDESTSISRYPLPRPVSQSTPAGKSLLSLKEVQSRIGHNHLCVFSAENQSRALYVSAELEVVLVELGDGHPRFNVIYELPQPISAETTLHPEYPSAAFFDWRTCIVADGHGLLYVLTINDGAPSTPISVHRLANSQPFQLHIAQKTEGSCCHVVLSFLRPREADHPKDTAQLYGVCAAKLDFRASSPTADALQPLEPVWQRKGSEPPIRVLTYSPTRCFILLGGSRYIPESEPQEEAYEPSSQEIAPIPSAGESLDSNATPTPPPPLSWTQTSDSLTIVIPLPSSTTKDNIKVMIGKQTLTLEIARQIQDTNATLLPSYQQRRFWGELAPESCIWTWERDAARSHGLLTLHLEKDHDHVRWPHVFEPSPSGDLDNVPEAVDPSELAGIREALEKYTASLTDSDGGGRPGLGLGQGASSLAQGELDDEVDSTVGRQILQTWIPWDEARELPRNTTPVTLLSSPLPGATSTETTSIITKNNLDGNLFTVKGAESNHSWGHTASFPALAFVLASKQDTRFVHHTEDTVLAFESGVREGTGNLFIYRKPARPKDNWAKQSVLNVAGGSPLLGVGAVSGTRGQKVVVCLTERELVIVGGVI